jgi:hypothetical protein
MRSGLGKSTVMKPICAPFLAYERELQAKHATRRPEIEAELAVIRKRIFSIIQKGAANDKTQLARLTAKERELLAQLKEPRLVVEDITSPRLAVLMQENRDVLASLSADARGSGKILLGRYNDGGLDEDIYLKAFSSDSARQDRVGRPGAALDDPCLSIAWATQPDLFDELFNNKTITTSGLMCRFLPLRVDEQTAEPSYAEQSAADEAVMAFGSEIEALLSCYHQAESGLTISADSKARKAIEDYSRGINRRVREGDLAAIGSFAARWGELAWRIALVFHCAEHGKNSHHNDVAEQTALNAIRVTEWFASHQQQLLERAAERSSNEKLEVALQFVNRSSSGVTAYELFRLRQSLFDNVQDARNALDQLEDEGSITSEPSRKSRRFYRKTAPRSR